jgi:hypothetical protein
MVAMQVAQAARVIKESNDIINKSKNTATRLSRCDTIIEIVEKLRYLETKGIPTIDPSPSKLVEIFTKERDAILYEGTKDEVERLVQKAELATSPKARLNNANSALLKIIDAKKETKDLSRFDDLEKRMKLYIHKIQLQSFLDAADKAEFKGDKKKALDQYQEALYFLRADQIDDELQQKEIKQIEAKIKNLQAGTPTRR